MIRVGFVCEGPTDAVVLEEVAALVVGDELVPSYLQPPFDALEGQWGVGNDDRVKQWCQGPGQNLPWSAPGVDVVVVQVDADRMAKYGADSTATLCDVIKGWLGHGAAHGRLIIAIPAQATDAWLLPLVEPVSPASEQLRTPAQRLAKAGRLARDEHGRPVKNIRAYRELAEAVGPRLPAVRHALPELDRFMGKLEHNVAAPAGGEASGTTPQTA